MKKFLSIFLALVMCIAVAVPAFAADTAAELKFGDDGKFKIMQLNDTQDMILKDVAEVKLIMASIEQENPDLLVFNGDQLTDFFPGANIKGLKKCLSNLFDIIDSYDIPFILTFGNHDHDYEDMWPIEEQMAFYKQYENCIVPEDGFNAGTYNVPVKSSDGSKVAFNIYMMDTNNKRADSDLLTGYEGVRPEQVEWYKQKSDELKAANGGEVVYSVAFQHIIVPEVYDALKKVDTKKLFSYEHIINKGEYYMFDPDGVNFGTLTETPCSGYENDGQFDAMVEKGDVLAMYTGHDHTNGFGVRHKGIDISNTVSTRYNGDAFSSQYGYRIIDIDENDTSKYTSRVEHWYDMFNLEDINNLRKAGDDYGWKLALDVDFKGFFQKAAHVVSRAVVSFFTGRQISYAD